MMGLGGYHIGMQKDEQLSIKIIRTAVDNGINFLDNCWDYNGGESEVRMGKALRDGYRQRVFLMTKLDGHDKKTAAAQIDESLKRLQTDHIDLMQFHEVIRFEDPDKIFAPGGSLEAALEAKKAGKIRYIGFTGHKNPDIHLKMLETADAHKFHFDTVQMPLNVMDAHFNSFGKKVLPVLVKKEIGVLGMKPMGSGMILAEQGRAADRMPALRDESADQRGDYRLRFAGNSGVVAECGADVQADERERSGGAAGEDRGIGEERPVRGLQDDDEF